MYNYCCQLNILVFFYFLTCSVTSVDFIGRTLEELAGIYLKRNSSGGGGYTCQVCSKTLRDKYAATDHLECKHFPTYGGYSCNICGKTMNTRNALTSHYTYCMKPKPC